MKYLFFLLRQHHLIYTILYQNAVNKAPKLHASPNIPNITTMDMAITEMVVTITDLATMDIVMDITLLSTLTETRTHMPHLQETSTLTDITTTLQLARL